MRFTTLITEGEYSPKAVAMYKSLGQVFFWHKLNKNQKQKLLSRADILAVGLSLNLDKNFLSRAKNLKVIATNTTGLNHIDMAYAAKRGIKVISLRGRTSFLKNIPSTAEETFALILALVRNLPWAFWDVVDAGRWDRMLWRGRQLHKKTIGLLGFGRLGKIVAKYARAFGMRVLASDPYVSKKEMEKRGVGKVKMEEVFKKSDIVSLHVLLTDDVYNLVKEKHLRMMKRFAYLINTARAELIEKNALWKALKNKWIAGAAIDVMWDEEPTGAHLKRDPLASYAKTHKNLIILPHVGGATFEAMEVTQDFIAELVVKHFK